MSTDPSECGDDNLIEALRQMPVAARLAALAKLEELRCRLDDDIAERLDDDR